MSCEDQAITDMPAGCLRWECSGWLREVQLSAPLVNHRGFRVCVNCGGSYGAAQPIDLCSDCPPPVGAFATRCDECPRYSSADRARRIAVFS